MMSVRRPSNLAAHIARVQAAVRNRGGAALLGRDMHRGATLTPAGFSPSVKAGALT